MSTKKLPSLVGLALAPFAGAYAAAAGAASKNKKRVEVRFKVRIENVSNAEGLTASNGTKYPFALSPGVYAVHEKGAPLFKAKRPAPMNGLEAQAEGGSPARLVESLKTQRGLVSTGVFDTPVGATAPGPIVPGGAYEFEFTATGGARLTLAMMFGQPNDLFYAPDESGIRLFDQAGAPVGGDITTQLILWDAGTEVNQEPGTGGDQAPRQPAPDTGAAENGVVRAVRDGFTYPKATDVFRVRMTPVQ